MLPLLGSAGEAIGGTPLVCLDRITSSLGLDRTIATKLDYLNPGWSKKDRVALGIIEEAERLGTLKPGQAVVELISGNMGTGLSIVCAVKGYLFIAVIFRGNSIEQAYMMSALDSYLDRLIDFVGSGGTYTGVTKKLESVNPAVKYFIVKPDGAAVLANKQISQPEHAIQGGGYVMPDLFYLKDVPVDGYLQITGDQAREGARLLASKEGIFGGFSSSANISAAIKLLKGEMRGKTIAMMVCDSGLKYLSTNLWAETD